MRLRRRNWQSLQIEEVGRCSDNPHALSVDTKAGAESSQTAVPSHVAQRGQIGSDSGCSSKSKCCGVLHEHVAGSNFANDSEHLRPEAASFGFDSCAFSSKADVLTGEASADDIDASAPRCSVEGSDVVPNGERRKDTVSLPLQQHASAVRLNLDSTDAGMSEKDAAEDSAASACEEVQFSEWGMRNV